MLLSKVLKAEQELPGLSGYEIVKFELIDDVSNIVEIDAAVSCPEGKKLLGGGGQAPQI
jgi:hypothetical protein